MSFGFVLINNGFLRQATDLLITRYNHKYENGHQNGGSQSNVSLRCPAGLWLEAGERRL